MCADTVVHEEEDPSDGKSDYAFDQYALPSDLSTGINTTGAYNQYYQDELALLSGFNITHNRGDSPPSSITDSNEPSNQYKLITPMQKHTRSKSAAGNSSPLLSLDNTIIDRSKSAAGDSTSQLSLTSSAIIHAIIDTKMAETKKSEQWEESHENAGGAKPDEDDQDGQDKKQRSAKPYSMSRGEKRKSRDVKNQQKSRLFLSERSKLYEFSQSNRILLVIPSSQSVNEESSTVHTLNPSIEAADAEILRVYDDIVKDYPDYPDLIIETGRTETTISYKLHELVPFSIGLCREMVVRDNSNKETLGVRSAVLRDGSLDKVFANCIRIVTNEYVNNIAQFIIVQSFLF
mgnify:CR=1 FL=1